MSLKQVANNPHLEHNLITYNNDPDIEVFRAYMMWLIGI